MRDRAEEQQKPQKPTKTHSLINQVLSHTHTHTPVLGFGEMETAQHTEAATYQEP